MMISFVEAQIIESIHPSIVNCHALNTCIAIKSPYALQHIQTLLINVHWDELVKVHDMKCSMTLIS